VKKFKRQLSHDPLLPYERKMPHSTRLLNPSNSGSPRGKSKSAQVRIRLYFLRLFLKMKLTSCQSRLQYCIFCYKGSFGQDFWMFLKAVCWVGSIRKSPKMVFWHAGWQE